MKKTLLSFFLLLIFCFSLTFATSSAQLTTIGTSIATNSPDSGDIDNSLVDMVDKQTEVDLVKELKDAKASLKLQSVKSCDEFDKVLTDWINKNKDWFVRPYPMPYYRGWIADDALVWAPTMDATNVSKSAVQESSATPWVGWGSPDYSATNVQKAGIDEPDIIKNDGKYIYYINNTKKLFYILKGPYNGSSIDLASTNVVKILRLPQTYNTTDLLIDGNTIALVSSRYVSVNYDYNRYFFDRSTKTNVLVLDITDKAKPGILRLFDFPGQLQDSRLSNGKLYVVSNLYFNRGPIYSILSEKKSIDDVLTVQNVIPSGVEAVKKVGGKMDKHTYRPDCSNLQYILPDSIDNYNPSVGLVHTVDLHSDKNVDTSLFYGNAGQIHVTDKSLYTVSSISLGSYGYDSCPPNAKCAMPLIRRAPDNFSLIHKYSLINWKPTYADSALIKWDLLNQYSMDEDAKGNFRILTRTWSPELSTHLWKFDNKLVLSGLLLGIEPKEDFKASRFIGDKLYLVTFQQIDPLFVIDLVPIKPKILGELKIPWFSQYLHPYTAMQGGKQLLIGLGTHTKEMSWRVTTDGVKVDLYDVDYNKVENWSVSIKQLFTKTLGGKGSRSEATENPRVFVWNEKTKELSLPLITQEEIEKKICNKDFYGQEYCYPNYIYNTTFAGIKALKIDTSNGISEVFSKDYKDQIMSYLKANNQYYGSERNNFSLDQWQYMGLGNRVWYVGDVRYFINNAFADFNSTNEGKLIKF